MADNSISQNTLNPDASLDHPDHISEPSHPHKTENNKYLPRLPIIILAFTLISLAGIISYVVSKPDKSVNEINHAPITTPNSTETATPSMSSNEVVDAANWQMFTSEEFGIRFKLPPKFYWNGGRSTGPEGDLIKPYELGVDTFIREDVGKVSCDLMGTFLLDSNNCNDDMQITRLALFSRIGTEPVANTGIDDQIFNFHITETPSWISRDDSLGCGNSCTYYYDEPVVILGKEYKVRLYYQDRPEGRFTEGIFLEEEVPAGPNSKWRTFNIVPFLGFADDAHTPYESGLSKTSRSILSTLEYLE